MGLALLAGLADCAPFSAPQWGFAYDVQLLAPLDSINTAAGTATVTIDS